MGRQGLMDDIGYHGFDDAEYMSEHYCHRCKNQPLELGADGRMWAVDCDRDCSLADPKCFEEEE